MVIEGFDGFSGGGVDDAGLSWVGLQKGDELGFAVLAFGDSDGEVFAIEAADGFVGILELELVDDVVLYELGGGGGEGGDWGVGEMVSEDGELAIFGAKGVSPL